MEKTPIIQYACEKCGISRKTYYRWIKEDSFFRLQVDDRIGLGVDRINDFAENNILSGIKRGDFRSTIYWLSHRNRNYVKPLKVIMHPDDSDAQRIRLEFAKRRAKEMQDRWFRHKPNKERDK